MKRTISKIASVLIVSAFIIFIISCKKDDKGTPITPQGTFAFHIHTNIDTSEVENYGDTYMLADGREVTVDMAQLYISNIKLIKKDGSIVDVPGKIILQKQDEEEYELDSVPAGNYETIRFDIGLDTTTNKTDATTATGVLAASDSMWFGATWLGYSFINVRGTIDTSAAKDGSKLAPFRYQIGSNALRKTITMPAKAFTVQSKQLQMVHLTTDYGKIFDGLDLHTELVTDTYSINSSLADKVANNILNLIIYED